MSTLLLGLMRIPMVPGLKTVYMTLVQSYLFALNENLAKYISFNFK